MSRAFNLMRNVARLLRGRYSIPPGSAKPTLRDIFSIAIYEGSSPLNLQPAQGVHNPVLTAANVSDLHAIYVADPFILRYAGSWHMFFEILPLKDQKGVIGHATSVDGLRWDYQQVVLAEQFHLSYPYVFEFEGHHYMVPESHQDNTVRLYQASEFPSKWKHVCNLLEDDEYADCSPILYNGVWWLFAGYGGPPCHANTLKLFFADELTGPWHEHPCSPIIADDPVTARPGGRVVVWDGRLMRFAQDCHLYYGQRLRAFEINVLTKETYSERLAVETPILAESHDGWNAAGMHHLDAYRMEDGRCFASVDGWCWGTATSILEGF